MAIGRIPEPGTGIPESILDAKGDLISASAADTPARLAVGTNDQRLVAASGETTGLKWVADTQNTVVDAKGDLIVGTAADTVARLAVGTNGHTLVANSSTSTGLEWQAFPSSTPTFAGCVLVNTTTQSINNATATAITWDTETIDTDGYHSTVTNTSRITIPSGKGGKYYVYWFCDWGATTSGYVRNMIYKNNVSQKQFSRDGNTPEGGTTLISCVLDLAVGDYVEAFGYQNSGSAKTAYVSGADGAFGAYLIGA